MELAFLVWAISLLPGLIGLTLALVIVSGLATFISFVGCMDAEVRKRTVLGCLALTIFFSLVAIALPNQKTAYIMVGAYATQQIAQDPKVQQIGAKTLVLIEQKLDEYIKQEPKK